MAKEAMVSRFVYMGSLTRPEKNNPATGQLYPTWIDLVGFDPDEVDEPEFSTTKGFTLISLALKEVKFFPRANSVYRVTREMKVSSKFYSVEIVKVEYLEEWVPQGVTESLRIAK